MRCVCYDKGTIVPGIRQTITGKRFDYRLESQNCLTLLFVVCLGHGMVALLSFSCLFRPFWGLVRAKCLLKLEEPQQSQQLPATAVARLLLN